MHRQEDICRKHFFWIEMATKTRKGRVFRPIQRAVMASTKSASACKHLSGLNRIGSSLTTHANMNANTLLGKHKRGLMSRRRFVSTKGKRKN